MPNRQLARCLIQYDNSSTLVDGFYVVIKLGHIEERLGHVGEVSDLHRTVCFKISFNLQIGSNDERDVE